jgi:hypothetical protein
LRSVSIERTTVPPESTRRESCIPLLGEEFTKRFRQEARVTARIRHHGVPQVFDAALDASFRRSIS